MKKSFLGYQWFPRQADSSVCDLLVRELGVSSFSASLLYHRGIRSADEADRFLNISLHDMHSPFLFRDMERAVDRIIKAIMSKERIVIYGDYDVDGITGVTILLVFLRYCGLDPLYYIPHRIREGYGLNAESIPKFSSQGATLLVTVDCGSSGEEAIRVAHQYGIDVIITDHHESASLLPQTKALLNPKRSDSGFPFCDLAGVGVAFYLLVALRTRLRELGYWDQRSEPNLARYLDLVALGTIADMVPLRKDNRILAKFGMDEIAVNRRPGLLALKEQAGVLDRPVDSKTILFRLGPRINAAGRLGFAEESVELFVSEDLAVAREIAHTLEGRNTERRSIEDAVYHEARHLAERQMHDQNSQVLVLASENWHRGILGIVASRVAKEFFRPTIIISLEENRGKGSARSVGDVLLLDALERCKDCLCGYGGHQGAAGIMIQAENLERFRLALDDAVRQQLGNKQELTPCLDVDSCLNSPQELTEKLVTEFDMFAPFGNGNTEPILMLQDMKILQKKTVGENHLRLVVAKDGIPFNAVGFGMAPLNSCLSHQERWDLAFTPYFDSWGGRTQIHLRLSDIRPS